MTDRIPSPFTIAIDGPAAAGKGTISRLVAERLGVAHLDTGLLYRAVGRRVLAGEEGLAAAQALTSADLEGDVLRSREVAEAASRVAADGAIRAALVDFQRAFARRSGGAVLDGRDIGTVICPQAEVKLYVTASDAVRAKRRHAELTSKGVAVSLEEVQADIARRDARDSGRLDAPMRRADDALLLDTSAMSIEEACDAAMAHIYARLAAAAS